MFLKPSLKCHQCSKIFKGPITLPCGHTICDGHLSELNVIKSNSIKCMYVRFNGETKNGISCEQEFNLSESKFMFINIIKVQIDNQDYLSREEKD